MPRFLRSAFAWLRQHPDLVALALIIGVATFMRLALTYRAPVFVRQDSIAYFQSAYELVRGIRVDIPIRRTPGYPLFLAASIWAVGEDMNAIALTQHALGILTAVVTYLLGRELMGRVAGIVAGVLVGLSAPLLIYEHYIMAEPLFTLFITLAMWLGIRGLKRRSAPSLLLCGLAVGLAYQSRPVGAAILPLLMAAAALWTGTFTQRAIRAGVLAAGFALVIVPILTWGWVTSAKAAPALGQTLYGRLVRHDERIVFPSADSAAPYGEPERVAARRLILQAAARDARPSTVNHRLQESLGLSEIEADRALRDVAFEIIGSQRERFIQGSISKTRAILEGDVEKLSSHWNGRLERELREGWQSNASIAHVLTPLSESDRREQPATEALLRVFQPAQHVTVLALLILAGLAAAALRPSWRLALLIPLVTLSMVIPAGILVGQVPRYRYPADPMLFVLVGGGATALIWGARAAGRYARRLVHPRAAAHWPATGEARSSTPG